jgi:hypothetical protein
VTGESGDIQVGGLPGGLGNSVWRWRWRGLTGLRWGARAQDFVGRIWSVNDVVVTVLGGIRWYYVVLYRGYCSWADNGTVVDAELSLSPLSVVPVDGVPVDDAAVSVVPVDVVVVVAICRVQPRAAVALSDRVSPPNTFPLSSGSANSP